MSELIPFHVPGQAPAQGGLASEPAAARPSAHGSQPLAVLRGGAVSRTRSTRHARRARRWDPAFHVDLLQF